MNAWLALFLAGICEIGFTTSMKLSDGFTKWIFIIPLVVSAAFSFWFLSIAMKTIPLGTAYAIWTGIGAAGTAAIGMLLFKDPSSLGRVVFLALLITSIIGLKIVDR